jgi:hypothetical protein
MVAIATYSPSNNIMYCSRPGFVFFMFALVKAFVPRYATTS